MHTLGSLLLKMIRVCGPRISYQAEKVVNFRSLLKTRAYSVTRNC
jgi:hypothetical protein